MARNRQRPSPRTRKCVIADGVGMEAGRTRETFSSTGGGEGTVAKQWRVGDGNDNDGDEAEAVEE